MKLLSPQKTIIIEALRDMKWHCGREWVDKIKDDRIRITELNRGYMKEKGYEIVGKPCKGSICGFRDCPLFMRRAQKIGEVKIQPKYKSILIGGELKVVLAT